MAEKIVNETRFDGFFAIVVDGVQRTYKTSYVSKLASLSGYLRELVSSGLLIV